MARCFVATVFDYGTKSITLLISFVQFFMSQFFRVCGLFIAPPRSIVRVSYAFPDKSQSRPQQGAQTKTHQQRTDTRALTLTQTRTPTCTPTPNLTRPLPSSCCRPHALTCTTMKNR